MSYLNFIEDVLKSASEIAKENYGKVKGITKAEDNNQVLTETDLKIGSFIIQQINKFFPNHNIVDEEAGITDKKSNYTWVIDPIDGTSNFAIGLPFYGIIIGLLEKDKPIAGGVSLPFFKEIILAEKEKGTFCNGEKLRISNEGNLSSTLVGYSIDSHQENSSITYEECKGLADIILGIRNLRATGSVFDAIALVKGKYGGYLNRTSKIWDNVGQQIIIEEAGGIYTDFFGNPIDYSNPLKKATDNFTFCAASPILHTKLQKIIHKK